MVLGIVNVTPDSFSDGGQHATTEAALAWAERLLEEGADVLDVGGESTRPGATRIAVEEELARVLPVVQGLRARAPHAILSVDTTRSVVARAALAEGAHIINDVSGLRLDAELAAVVAGAGAGLILMHSRGDVSEMASYDTAIYGADPVAEVVDELLEAVARARAAGVPDEAMVIDPGIGFSKRTEHSLAVLHQLPRLVRQGFPVMVGASRKRVIGAVTGEADPARRDAGSVGAHVAALALGARLFRVHDVRAHRQALDAAWAVLQGSASEPDAR
ncbi:MAG TPA: dihydropteroate synthase [Gemmatimonadaceae bacterium]